MKVTIEKKVTETINVEPGYYKNRLTDCFYYLHESGALIYISNSMTYFTTPERGNYGKDIKEIVTDYIPCDKSEFEAAKDMVLVHLKHYVSFPETASTVNPLADSPAMHTMNNTIDPKEGQQEEVKAVEQATEAEQNAVESAAQDAAVEVDSEEGSIEG